MEETDARFADIEDILLDENNVEPIVLYTENGKKTLWDQIAVIPFDDEIYVLLHPLEGAEEIADDEAVVFKLVRSLIDGSTLVVESDEDVCTEVFERYLALLEDA